MDLIRNNKPAIQQQLLDGFDCVRDELTVDEVKRLSAAAEYRAMPLARLAA